jgi:hypothetical protein
LCKHTIPPSSANFVGFVVGFLNVLKYTLSEPTPSRLVIVETQIPKAKRGGIES